MRDPGKTTIRLGLCCLFRDQPLRYRQTTAKALRTLPRQEQLARLSALCLHNVTTLRAALHFLAENNICAYRLPSPLFPRCTHPEVGYRLDELPDGEQDPRPAGNGAGLCPGTRYPPEPASRPVQRPLLPAHGSGGQHPPRTGIPGRAGGAGGSRGHYPPWRRTLRQQGRSPADGWRTILPASPQGCAPASPWKTTMFPTPRRTCCRCAVASPSPLSTMSITIAACRTASARKRRPPSVSPSGSHLGREPYFHLSSPKNGWGSGSPKPHADYIAPADFPRCWLAIEATIDIEAKAKELAILRLRQDLRL